jgi:hypothetical protein
MIFPNMILNQSNLLVATTRTELHIIFSENIVEPAHPAKKSHWHRYISFVAFFLSFFAFSPSTSFATEEIRTFIVTAYYSPLPDQTFYFK